jgi:hypothetical protein
MIPEQVIREAYKKPGPPPGPPRKCSIPECGRRHVAHGWCGLHYGKAWRGSPDPSVDRRRWKRPSRPCSVVGCDKAHYSLGFCETHYGRSRRHGDPLVVGRKPNGSGSITVGGYVLLRSNGLKILQHRLVMERKKGRPLYPHENVHHKNGDRSDNREANLELWETSQPAGQRIEDKVAYARELLGRYAHEIEPEKNLALAREILARCAPVLVATPEAA